MAPGNPVTPSLLSCLAGLRQCRAGVAFGLGRWGFECGEDDGGTLDDLQALGQKCGVAVIQVDVIGGCLPVFKPMAVPMTNAIASASVSLNSF